MKRQLQTIILTSLLFLFSQQAWSQDCTDNCVWSGDANTNGICNNLDILPIGLAFGATGPARNFVSPDPWEPQTAEDWSQDLPVSGTNYKHIDTNGDGIINELDAIIVGDNLNATNDSFTVLAGHEFLGDDLFIEFDQSQIAPGQELTLSIHLGTSANPIENLYGIAFSLEVIEEYIEFNNPPTFPDSWLGTATECINYEKVDLPTWNEVYLAKVRTDGTSSTGGGIIAQVSIVIADVILPLIQDSTAVIPFPFKFKNVLAINEFEEEIPIGVRHDSVEIRHASFITSTVETSKNSTFQVFPNPAKNQIFLQSEQPLSDVKVYNNLGKMLLQQPEESVMPFHLNISDLAAGVYFVTAVIDKRRVRQKFVKGKF